MANRPQTHYARGQARRHLLLEAATEEIAEKGLEGITHRSVAARAGVPLSTTSYFFGSLDELIGATITHLAEVAVASYEPLFAEAMAGAVGVEEFSDRIIGLLADAGPHQLIVQFEAYLATQRRPELQEAVQQIITAFETATVQALSAIGVPQADSVARQFVAVIDGFALHRLAWPRGEADREAMTAALRRLLDSYLSEAPAAKLSTEARS